MSCLSGISEHPNADHAQYCNLASKEQLLGLEGKHFSSN